MVSGGSVRFSGSGTFLFDAKGLRIAYLAEQQRDETFELFGSSSTPHVR